MTTMQSETCFVCGKNNPKGLQLSFEAEDGTARTEWTVTKDYIGYPDILHGGILMTLIDETMVDAAQSLGTDCVTAQISVNFKKPIFVGEHLVFKGFVEGEPIGRKIKTRCQVLRGDTIVSEATGVIMTIEPGKFGKKI
jgi:uncharacterized protein (TIGR00369 family)